MPRLIPRLLRNLERARALPPKPRRERAQQPSNHLVTENSVFTRPGNVDITPTGRTQSILLERHALRLIYRHTRWRREKALGPTLRVSKVKWEGTQRRGQVPPCVLPRAMTEEERTLYANPYLRMLGSPLRRCFETNWTLPRDLMIRMTPMLIPGDNERTVFLPTGLEHPAFRRFRGGKTHYLLCWKPALEFVQQTGSFKRWRPETLPVMWMHPLVVQQVSHALRVRVLQELHLLARHLRRKQQPSSPPLLRRLTRTEWKEVRSSGFIPFKNAVAVLVVPPLNRDPISKGRPVPNASSVPTDEDITPRHQASQTLPPSVMYRANKAQPWEGVDDSRLLPPAQVPLYNGVPLFPSRTQRAALHAALTQVLEVERKARSPMYSQSQPAQTSFCRAKGDQKASHAILICSDESTLLRGDTVPLVVALWRLRMWETGCEGDPLVHWTTRSSQT